MSSSSFLWEPVAEGLDEALGVLSVLWYLLSVSPEDDLRRTSAMLKAMSKFRFPVVFCFLLAFPLGLTILFTKVRRQDRRGSAFAWAARCGE